MIHDHLPLPPAAPPCGAPVPGVGVLIAGVKSPTYFRCCACQGVALIRPGVMWPQGCPACGAQQWEQIERPVGLNVKDGRLT